ncbi:UNVERIFIED_CONTAM: hypothetical protein K2H54_043932 [Gekko kuhli]
MEERAVKEESEAEVQQLPGPKHCFSNWERQCLVEDEQDNGTLPAKLQDDEETATEQRAVGGAEGQAKASQASPVKGPGQLPKIPHG